MYLILLVFCVDAAGCEDGQDCYFAEGATQGECKSSTDETIDLQKRNSLNFHHLIYGFTFDIIFWPPYIIFSKYIYFFQVLCNDGAGCDEGEDCYVPDGESKGECKKIHVEPGNKLFL